MAMIITFIKMNSKSTKKIKIVIYGTGGCGIDFLWTIKDCNKKSKQFEVIGFLNDDKKMKGKTVSGYPVLGGMNWFSTKEAKNVQCVVAIADPRNRKKIVEKLEKKGIKFPTIIHPSVIFSKFKEIGEGVVIQAGCILGPETSLANHVQINMDCTIGHGSRLENYVTLATGVHVNGDNCLGEGAFVGTGVVTKEKITIGKWAIVAGGSCAIRNLKEYRMYAGVPAKMKKTLK